MKFITRATDDTLKLWDIRNSSKPVFVWEDLSSVSGSTSVALSPNEKVIVTGTASSRRGQDVGRLVGFNTLEGGKVCDEGICKDAVVSVIWP